MSRREYAVHDATGREYAVHDATGRSRGLAPYGNTDEERLASCYEVAEMLTRLWADRDWATRRDVFTVVTREVTEWEPVV